MGAITWCYQLMSTTVIHNVHRAWYSDANALAVWMIHFILFLFRFRACAASTLLYKKRGGLLTKTSIIQVPLIENRK